MNAETITRLTNEIVTAIHASNKEEGITDVTVEPSGKVVQTLEIVRGVARGRVWVQVGVLDSSSHYAWYSRARGDERRGGDLRVVEDLGEIYD